MFPKQALFAFQLKIIGWKGKIGFVINHFASREWRVNHKSRSPSYFNFHSVPILNLHQIHYPRWGGRTMELNFQWNLVNGKVHELEPTWLEGWRRNEEAQICLALTTNRWNTNRRKMLRSKPPFQQVFSNKFYKMLQSVDKTVEGIIRF